MRIACVVGTRPNFVKIAPLLREMRRHRVLDPLLVHTGQHYDANMSDSFFRDLEIPPPDVSLGMGQAPGASEIENIVARLEPVLARMRPDMVLVVGDVNSTLGAALAATRAGIPIAHVEAGLRSFDRSMPEETNRILTDAVSDLLFVSEPSGVRNLQAEGIPDDRIVLAGNVMIDSLRASVDKAAGSGVLRDLGLADMSGALPRPYVLLTLHRQGLVENPGALQSVWGAITVLARQIPIVFPVHPRTQNRLRELGSEFYVTSEAEGVGIKMVAPLGYLQFLHLERMARLVMTDSGGVQEETSALGVPCLTLRENTERPMTVTEGTNTVVGLDPDRILREARRVLAGSRSAATIPPLWDGHAARRIVEVLCARAAAGSAIRCTRDHFIASSWTAGLGEVAMARHTANQRALAGM